MMLVRWPDLGVDLPSLPFTPAHLQLIKEGRKTQTTRRSRDRNLRPGALFMAHCSRTHQGCAIRITSVHGRHLGFLDEEDAYREGGYTLEEFQQVWRSLHRGKWNPDARVWVIRFAVLQPEGPDEDTAGC